MSLFQVVSHWQLTFEHIHNNITSQIYTKHKKWTFEIIAYGQLWYQAFSYRNIFCLLISFQTCYNDSIYDTLNEKNLYPKIKC
jgi:hypothetical protein